MILALAFMDLTSLFQALLDATYVLECRLVNEDFPQDRSEKEIEHLIGTSNVLFKQFVANLRLECKCKFEYLSGPRFKCSNYLSCNLSSPTNN